MKQHNTSLQRNISPRSSLLTLTSLVLAMALASCIPDQRNPGGVAENGRSGGKSVEFGGDGLSGGNNSALNNNGFNNGNNTDQTIPPKDPNADPNAKKEELVDNSIRLTKRTEELWSIACQHAVKGDIGMMMKDAEGKDVPSTDPINPKGEPDSDNDGISDDCERFLALSPNFGATNPQLYNGYVVGAVRLSPSILKTIAEDAAAVKGTSSLKNAKGWAKIAKDWKKTDKWIDKNLTNRSENTRLWLGRAMCALSSSGRLSTGDKDVSRTDSGGIVRVIFREHMKKATTNPADEALLMEMENSRTISKKVYDKSGDPTKEHFALVEGGMQNTLIHNVFFDQNEFKITGPKDIYTGEDDENDILYIAEAMIETDRSMDLKLVHLNELGQPTQGDVKSAFLATLDGDTEISSIDLTGTFDFALDRPKIFGGISQKDCKFDQKRLATTIPASSTRKHFMLASFYLGKQSRNTFFRENLMVQYLKGKEYMSSMDKKAEDDYKDRFEEYEEVPIDQAKNIYEFMPQNIATISTHDLSNTDLVLMPFMPKKDELKHLATHNELSGEQYWGKYKTSAKVWPDLLTSVTKPASGSGTVTYESFAMLDHMLDPYSDYVEHIEDDNNSVEEVPVTTGQGYAGGPADVDPEASYVDPEVEAYEREEQGDV